MSNINDIKDKITDWIMGFQQQLEMSEKELTQCKEELNNAKKELEKLQPFADFKKSVLMNVSYHYSNESQFVTKNLNEFDMNVELQKTNLNEEIKGYEKKMDDLTNEITYLKAVIKEAENTYKKKTGKKILYSAVKIKETNQSTSEE